MIPCDAGDVVPFNLVLYVLADPCSSMSTSCFVRLHTRHGVTGDLAAAVDIIEAALQSRGVTVGNGKGKSSKGKGQKADDGIHWLLERLAALQLQVWTLDS